MNAYVTEEKNITIELASGVLLNAIALGVFLNSICN